MLSSVKSVSPLPLVKCEAVERDSSFNVTIASSMYSDNTTLTSIPPPSPLVHFAKKMVEPLYTPAKTFKQIDIQGGKDCAMIVPSSIQNLTNATVSTLKVTGIVSAELIEIISHAEKVDTIHFNRCYFKCRSAEFYPMIRSVSATCLTFVGCEFSDSYMIGDELFWTNPQIQKIVVAPANKERFSFPNLTDATIALWKHTVPAQIHFTNVQTCFTAQSVADVAKSLTRNHSFSWNLGKIVNEVSDMAELFSELSAEHVKRVVFQSSEVFIRYRNKNVIIFKCNCSEPLFDINLSII